jgi:hypothetical protein
VIPTRPVSPLPQGRWRSRVQEVRFPRLWFSEITLCSLAGKCQRFKRTYCFHLIVWEEYSPLHVRIIIYQNKGGISLFRNVGTWLLDCTVLEVRNIEERDRGWFQGVIFDPGADIVKIICATASGAVCSGCGWLIQRFEYKNAWADVNGMPLSLRWETVNNIQPWLGWPSLIIDPRIRLETLEYPSHSRRYSHRVLNRVTPERYLYTNQSRQVWGSYVRCLSVKGTFLIEPFNPSARPPQGVMKNGGSSVPPPNIIRSNTLARNALLPGRNSG